MQGGNVLLIHSIYWHLIDELTKVHHYLKESKVRLRDYGNR